MYSALIVFCDYIFQFFVINISTVSIIILLNMILLLLFLSLTSFSGFTVVRGFFQYLLHFIIDTVTSLLYNQTEGYNNLKYANVLLCLFFFIFSSNLVGLFPFSIAPTAQLIVPVYLAFFVFLFLIDNSLYRDNFLSSTITNKGGSKTPFLIKVLFPETIVRISQPISLSMRLFSNMLAGHFLLSVIVAANRLFLLLDFPSLVIIGFISILLSIIVFLFELVVAFLQSYVFTLLSMTYLSTGVAKANY